MTPAMHSVVWTLVPMGFTQQTGVVTLVLNVVRRKPAMRMVLFTSPMKVAAPQAHVVEGMDVRSVDATAVTGWSIRMGHGVVHRTPQIFYVMMVKRVVGTNILCLTSLWIQISM